MAILTSDQNTPKSGSGSTSSEALSQLVNRVIKERRILTVNWSNAVPTSQSKSLFRAGAIFLQEASLTNTEL